jgi:hypothetical protein
VCSKQRSLDVFHLSQICWLGLFPSTGTQQAVRRDWGISECYIKVPLMSLQAGRGHEGHKAVQGCFKPHVTNLFAGLLIQRRAVVSHMIRMPM